MNVKVFRALFRNNLFVVIRSVQGIEKLTPLQWAMFIALHKVLVLDGSYII